MSKLFLEVQVPGNAKTYEFIADSTMAVGRVKRQIIRQISDLEGRDIFPKAGEVLFCSANLGGLLRDQEILAEVGVVSGDRVILI